MQQYQYYHPQGQYIDIPINSYRSYEVLPAYYAPNQLVPNSQRPPPQGLLIQGRAVYPRPFYIGSNDYSARLYRPVAPYVYQPYPFPGLVVPPPPRPIFDIGVEQLKLCRCGRYFTSYAKRKGIHILLLLLIIWLSCFMFLFLLLLLWKCEEYNVCPHCGKSSGRPESNFSHVCLC